MVGVERWAEIRRAYFVEGVGIRALARRTGLDRRTIRRALRSDVPPRYERLPVASKLDPYREEIHRLLRADPMLPATRVRELIADQGYGGGRTILETYLREIRPVLAPPPRSFQRTLYRPAGHPIWIGGWCWAYRPTRTCGWIPATTHSIRAWWAGESR